MDAGDQITILSNSKNKQTKKGKYIDYTILMACMSKPQKPAIEQVNLMLERLLKKPASSPNHAVDSKRSEIGTQRKDRFVTEPIY